MQTIYQGMSTMLTIQASEKSHGLIKALPHVSEVWAALLLPEARPFKKMPAQSSAVAASAAPDRPHGTKENTGWCGTKRNPEHTSPLPNPLIPFRDTSSRRKNVGCWLVQSQWYFTQFCLYNSLSGAILECDLMENRPELGMTELG